MKKLYSFRFEIDYMEKFDVILASLKIDRTAVIQDYIKSYVKMYEISMEKEIDVNIDLKKLKRRI